MTSKKRLLEEINKVPDKCGVYLFMDTQNNPLYVGKARFLKQRMKSYFKPSHPHSPKTSMMIKQVANFDFYLTDNEVEALILEFNLIKKYRPPFNIYLRDDKSYPYLAINLEDEFPRVMITRAAHKKGVKYYGPYTKAQAIRETLDSLRKIFPVRTCRGKKPGRPDSSPCLNYHIKRCLGPCIGKVSVEEYDYMIRNIMLFLEGRQNQVIKELGEGMAQASRELNFELAANLRNRLNTARQVLKKQKMLLPEKKDFDVITFLRDDCLVWAEVFQVRQGMLVGSENFAYEVKKEEKSEALLVSFIKQFYMKTSLTPREIFLPFELEEKSLIEQWLEKEAKGKVKIIVPQRGKKKDLMKLAERNAQYGLEMYKSKRKYEQRKAYQAIAGLQKALKLTSPPYRIECYDVSALRGKQSVGAMVVFQDGYPEKSSYRKFKIRKVLGQDDFSMMKEIVERRFLKFLENQGKSRSKFGKKPDLIVVDGGRPQLSAARETLEKLKIKDIPVAALAKKEEQIYTENQSQPLSLPWESLSLQLIRRIRDEAHRFAIAYHRGLREKKMVRSFLDTIPGIGSIRKKELINHFKTPRMVKSASLEELSEVNGISKKLAQKIYSHLH